VVKPRQPLYDLNPFDSILLILRRVGVGARVVPTLLPELPLVGFRRWLSRFRIRWTSRVFPSFPRRSTHFLPLRASRHGGPSYLTDCIWNSGDAPKNICLWAAISANLTPIESAICGRRGGKVSGQPARGLRPDVAFKSWTS